MYISVGRIMVVNQLIIHHHISIFDYTQYYNKTDTVQDMNEEDTAEGQKQVLETNVTNLQRRCLNIIITAYPHILTGFEKIRPFTFGNAQEERRNSCSVLISRLSISLELKSFEYVMILIAVKSLI